MTDNKRHAPEMTDAPTADNDRPALPLGRINFILMAICGLVILIGFILMLGSSQDGDTFNADIYSTRRVVVGPTVCITGFTGMAFAIIYNRRKNK